MSFLTTILNSEHNRKEFSCNVEMLDNYLYHRANQDVKRKLSACFVMIDPNSLLIMGYYTLANNSIAQKQIPYTLKKKLPKAYHSIPTTLIGRLAVDSRFKGKGIGKLLLFDALNRSYQISKSIGSYAVVVDPFDRNAENFYEQYGFIKIPDSGKMFLQMKTIKVLFE